MPQPNPPDLNPPAHPASLLGILTAFSFLGATTFGGMWGASRQIERELSERRGWIDAEEMNFYLVAATLVPAPKFMGFAGMVGYKLRGFAGSALAIFGVLIPSAVAVMLGAVLVSPTVLATEFGPLQRTLSIAVAGIVFGTAARHLRNAKVSATSRMIGLAIVLAMAVAIVMGAPLILVIAIAFVLGTYVIKGKTT